MTDHLRRAREYIAIEAETLKLAARRARLLDHDTNRGTEAERALARWIRDRIEPEYTVSSGEIIDSFNTDVDLESRQHDIIVHENSRDAKRFLLPNGINLVPVESVAAVIEVKLQVDKTEFARSDKAAAQTNRLRLALDSVRTLAGAGGPVRQQVTPGPAEGIPAHDPALARRMTFFLFAFEGPQKETIAGWLQEETTIKRVCCLESGFVARADYTTPGQPGLSHVVGASEALMSFAEHIYTCIRNHLSAREDTRARYGRYQPPAGMTYWDETGGYQFPDSYNPTDDEIERAIALGLVPAGWLRPADRPKDPAP